MPSFAKGLCGIEWTHRLVPCLRLPKSAKKPEREFFVHEHFEENCQGVAGLIYARGRLATVELPNLHGANVVDATYAQYAALTNDTFEQVRENSYYSQRIGGVTIYVDGQRWGLIVLDSADPNALDDAHLNAEAMNRTLKLVTAVLEKGLA